MKNLILIFLIAFTASLQAQTYITTTGTVILEAGSIESFTAPTLFLNATYETRDQIWIVDIGITSGVISASSPIKHITEILLTKAAVDGYTGTGTGDSAKAINAVSQAVKAYVEALNVSSTVTII